MWYHIKHFKQRHIQDYRTGPDTHVGGKEYILCCWNMSMSLLWMSGRFVKCRLPRLLHIV